VEFDSLAQDNFSGLYLNEIREISRNPPSKPDAGACAKTRRPTQRQTPAHSCPNVPKPELGFPFFFAKTVEVSAKTVLLYT
jgi:hypothetical protein